MIKVRSELVIIDLTIRDRPTVGHFVAVFAECLYLVAERSSAEHYLCGFPFVAKLCKK